jgi:RNA polymerase sigma-70 factor (ECF subfamily)
VKEVMRVQGASSSGKEAKLEKWVSEYSDAVLQTCFVYLADRTMAEDAMQDTFIKAWKSMERFEGRSGCSEKTWIMRIAINTCKDYKRSAWFKHVDLSKALEEMPQPLQMVSDESRFLFVDLMGLPSKLKQVVLLYHYQDMSMAEVGQALQISRSAVQDRLQKAYSLLRYQAKEGGVAYEI